MRKSNLYRIHVALIAAVAFAGSVSAATWSGGNGNWDTDASWGGSEPTSGTLATIDNGDTVTVDQTGEIAGQLQVFSSSTVNVDTGGDLTLDVASGASLNIGSSGALNVAGGAVAAGGIVNNYLNGSGEINVSAGSFTHAWSLRIGDGATTGTIDVSGSGSWWNGNFVGVGTSIINLTGSAASISANEILMWDTTLEVNLTPGSTGIDTIDLSGRLLLGTAGGRSQTLNFDTDGYLGARTVVLFSYGGALTGTFKTTNITRTGVGNLTLGSDPGGDPVNLGENQYYLDYGDGSDDSVTLYYNVPRSATITVTTADGMVINGVGELSKDAVSKNANFSPTAAGGGNQQFHFLTLDTATLEGLLEDALGPLASGERYKINSATFTAGVSTPADGNDWTEYQSNGGITVHAVKSTSAFNVDQATWNNRATGTSWAGGSVSTADWGATITTGVDNTAYSTLFSGLASTLQGWVFGGANYGLAFEQTGPSGAGPLSWTNSDNVVLTIEAEAGPPQGTLISIR